MNQMLELLQYIARTAYKTQETVKTLSIYYDVSNTTHINNIYKLLENVKNNSIKTSFEVITQTDINELKDSLHIINESIESSQKIYSILKGSIPISVPENLKHKLEANLNSLNVLLAQMTTLPIKEPTFNR